MEDAGTCEICFQRFADGERDPLALQCGHTYCRMCINNLKERKRDFSCPICRRVHKDVDINKLPIIYKLLNLNVDGAGPELSVCKSHGDELTYWCQKCQQKLCALCLFRGHPQDHDVFKIKLSLEEKKRRLRSKVLAWQHDINETHKDAIYVAFRELKRLFQFQVHLSRSKRILTEMLSQVEDVSSMEAISEVEDQLKSLRMVHETLISEGGYKGTDVPVEQGASTSASGMEAISEVEDQLKSLRMVHETLISEGGYKGTDVPVEQGASTSASGSSHTDSSRNKKVSYINGAIQRTDGSNAVFQWEDGKLLLSAFKETISCNDLLLQMPSQVFLKISIRSQLLGTVIIQPFYHMRRAQLFTALCVGTFGVSYVGSTFRRVENRNRPREYLSGGWYLDPADGGVLTNTELMTGLEWDGEASGPSHEGAILGVTYTPGESGFGICTRAQDGGTFKCLFGKVVTGLNVVKDAVLHNPVSDVVISECGLCFADPTL